MADAMMPFDASVAAPSRRYNAWQGGKDNLSADRASADAVERAFPAIKGAVAQQRRCVLRAVRVLAAECGIRQFLDIGCGLPDPRPLVHEVAQNIAPDSRIAYIDNDPIVEVHTRALATDSTPAGRVGFHPGDLRDPAHILAADPVRAILDLTQPVAALLFAVAHFIPDDATVTTAIQTLMAGLPSGSYLAFSHATLDPLDHEMRAALAPFAKPGHGNGPFTFRSHQQIAALFDGLDLIEPGLVSTVRWRPDLDPRAEPTFGEDAAICYAAVGCKP